MSDHSDREARNFRRFMARHGTRGRRGAKRIPRGEAERFSSAMIDGARAAFERAMGAGLMAFLGGR